MNIEIINKLNLSNDDKNILINAISTNDMNELKKLSIFYKNGNYKKLNDYEYYENLDNDFIYMINIGNFTFYITKNKKVLFDSIYITTNIHTFKVHIGIFKYLLEFLDNLNFDNYNIEIIDEIITIQRWFITYGHYMDEVFNLYDFYHNYNNKYAKILNFINHSDLIKLYGNYNNYVLLDKYLFNNNSISSYNPEILIACKKICLIKHDILMPTFHKFPKTAKDKIFNNIIYNNINNINNYDIVLITRGIATHMPRNLNNQKDIEIELKNKMSNNLFIINPETSDLLYFINIISKAKKIIITWGGALTNLVYLNKNTKVIILKSLSYKNESIKLFNKIILDNDLNINIIEADVNNNIDPQIVINNIL